MRKTKRGGDRERERESNRSRMGLYVYQHLDTMNGQVEGIIIIVGAVVAVVVVINAVIVVVSGVVPYKWGRAAAHM